MSTPGLIVLILHTMDKVLYHQNTTYNLLYEIAHNGQGFVPPVQLPLYLIWCSSSYGQFATELLENQLHASTSS
jgi:hypothetical protein